MPSTARFTFVAAAGSFLCGRLSLEMQLLRIGRLWGGMQGPNVSSPPGKDLKDNVMLSRSAFSSFSATYSSLRRGYKSECMGVEDQDNGENRPRDSSLNTLVWNGLVLTMIAESSLTFLCFDLTVRTGIGERERVVTVF